MQHNINLIRMLIKKSILYILESCRFFSVKPEMTKEDNLMFVQVGASLSSTRILKEDIKLLKYGMVFLKKSMTPKSCR